MNTFLLSIHTSFCLVTLIATFFDPVISHMTLTLTSSYLGTLIGVCPSTVISYDASYPCLESDYDCDCELEIFLWISRLWKDNIDL